MRDEPSLARQSNRRLRSGALKAPRARARRRKKGSAGQLEPRRLAQKVRDEARHGEEVVAERTGVDNLRGEVVKHALECRCHEDAARGPSPVDAGLVDLGRPRDAIDAERCEAMLRQPHRQQRAVDASLGRHCRRPRRSVLDAAASAGRTASVLTARAPDRGLPAELPSCSPGRVALADDASAPGSETSTITVDVKGFRDRRGARGCRLFMTSPDSPKVRKARWSATSLSPAARHDAASMTDGKQLELELRYQLIAA